MKSKSPRWVWSSTLPTKLYIRVTIALDQNLAEGSGSLACSFFDLIDPPGGPELTDRHAGRTILLSTFSSEAARVARR